MDEDIRIGAAATALGVSIDTLRRWEQRGQIRFERRGSQRYLSHDELARILRERGATPPSTAPNRLPGIVLGLERAGSDGRGDARVRGLPGGRDDAVGGGRPALPAPGRQRRGGHQCHDRRGRAGVTEPPPGTPGLRTLRHEYETHGLDRGDVDPDPFEQFGRWYADAAAEGIYEPHAVALSTAGPDGRPACRYVLLRGVEASGFQFFTSYTSAKARDLDASGHAALTWGWLELHRSVRASGRVQRLPDRRQRRVLRRAGRAAARSPRGPRRRARCSPTARTWSAAWPRPRRASPAGRSRDRRTGVATCSCPTRSSSGRAASAACTTACATGAPTAAGSSSAWRPERRRTGAPGHAAWWFLR